MGDAMESRDNLKEKYPEKLLPIEEIFDCIHRGDRLFIGTGCGEPQYLVNTLLDYVESHPKNIVESEILHIWTLGVTPYADSKFKRNFRYNSFFIGESTRDIINEGLGDYTPMFLSQVPELFKRELIPVDVALVQTSPPDGNGNLSFGVSVDITKSAVESASIVICQINSNMPYVHGETTINIKDVDFLVQHDEELLEYHPVVADELAGRIGRYVARIIKNGDTIQVGYGSIPNAILANLKGKEHLGIHTELLTDGIVDLMKEGVIDNSEKTLHKGKTVATLCMGRKSTYQYINDNPLFEFMPIDYTNSPLVVAKNRNMTAINSALSIDLTGQATAESIGGRYYSGIGGQADFMRGAVFACSGKTILTIPSTTGEGKTSRIVCKFEEGTKVTLSAADIHYVVTEYGTAYMHGKNVRERAMELISIAHPDFRLQLIEEAKQCHLIYQDQKFVPGKEGEYPEELERFRTISDGTEILMRPAKISDEPLIKDFFYSLSDKSNYRRFFTLMRYMPHKVLQDFVAVDYTKKMVILALLEEDEKETVIGVGQYAVLGETRTAEVAIAIRDEYQNRGIGTALFKHLGLIAKREGLHGFSGDYIAENIAISRLVRKLDSEVKEEISQGVCHFETVFEGPSKQELKQTEEQGSSPGL
ncbi:MAG: GNAT family N-acetyltransferase [Actinobacteria bacterium]|nr:GNAT family N-acetyltransferase [Actinomycetota bacterium]